MSRRRTQRKQDKRAAEQTEAPIGDEHWPSLRLKSWPISPQWTPQAPKKKIGPLVYQKVIGAVQHLFSDPALSQTLARLQDYCFQQGQGALSNANARDRGVFTTCLTHDLIFFSGDQDRPILEDLPLDQKVYNAFPQMEGSLLDLYRVEHRGLFGGLKVQSLLREAPQTKGGTRLLAGPRSGDFFLGRFVQIGRGWVLDEPYLILSEEIAMKVQKTVEEEYAATRAKHSGLTKESFLKVAGYHLYEEGAAHLLMAHFASNLPPELTLKPLACAWTPKDPKTIPKLTTLSNAKIADQNAAGEVTMVTVNLSKNSHIPPTLRDAIVSVDGESLDLLSFLAPQHEPLIKEIDAVLPQQTPKNMRELTLHETYRSLRHTLRVR